MVVHGGAAVGLHNPWNMNSSVFIVHKCQASQKAGFLKEAIQNLILALKTTSF